MSVPAGDAKFFVLTSAQIPQTACTVTFTSNAIPPSGQQVAIAGNHPILGSWSIRPDLLNVMLPSTNSGARWSTLPLRFPSGLPLVYQNVLGVRGIGMDTVSSTATNSNNTGVQTWEYTSGTQNRLFIVPPPSITTAPVTASVASYGTYTTPDGAVVKMNANGATVTQQG
ncbi:carbohydrate-binding module family 20 domain-containing protein [Candidatus Finniella inopinata]|uniref:carbohydrate-binding module family 20 domain-containing protein n=1 Tax=Candidatus Finniella inopinata TaxID=1696036 RepID=UPI0013EE545B|nr:carbohydrate-binding module family 20 domain-containing protein [Candidatus Finniella inopinata]